MMIKRASALLALALLAGCAQSESGPAPAAVSSSAPPAPAPAQDTSVPGPGWRVGLAWPDVTREDLLASSRAVFNLCVLGKDHPLGGLRLATVSDGYRLVAPVSGANVYALRVQQNPADPSAQDVELAWDDSVPPELSVTLLKQIKAVMERQAPC